MQLKEYLASRHITYAEFAKMIGVSTTTIMNYISAKRRPSIKNGRRIEIMTNGKVTIDDLIEHWEKKNNDQHRT